MPKKYIYKLKNGIKVIIVPLDTKLTSISLSIKLGHAHEKKNETGLSHFMEHLMARMTSQKYPDDKYISQELSRRGAYVNAYVSEYETKFYIRGLFKDIAFYLDVLSNGIFNFQMISGIAEKEKHAAIHELQQNIANQNYLFDYKIKGFFYPKHYYQYDDKQIIQFLKTYDIHRITEFIKTHLDIKNATVSVSCPIDSVSKTKKLIQTYFENQVQKYKVNLQYPKTIHINKGLKIFHIKNPQNENNVLFHIYVNTSMKFLSDEYLCLLIFNKLLCNFETGVLYNVLRKQHSLIYSINFNIDVNLHDSKSSLYYFQTATDSKNVSMFLYHFLDIMKKYTFREEHIEHIKNFIDVDMENQKFYTLTSVNDKYEKFLLHNRPVADEETEVVKRLRQLKMPYIKKMLRKFQNDVLENAIIFYYSHKNKNSQINKLSSHFAFTLHTR
jgi:predicted Zn-dependent peptidase